MSEKEEHIELEGEIVEALKGSFRVKIDSSEPNGEPILVNAHLGGKLKKNFIKIVKGDRVRVSLSPYDLKRGIITYRMK
jgi:translation initiation factor IF-1